MKTMEIKSRRILHTVIYAIPVFILLTLLQLSANANMGAVQETRDSIIVNKLLTSKKYKIKVFPGATGEALFFSASGEDGKVYQLFMFDLDGVLVKQTQIRNKQTTILTNFNKGCYTFEVFSDDEHIENGTLTIK